MNTVILVSVLCTLGVVAMVGTVVVAFMKLNRKVDDEGRDVRQEIGNIYDTIGSENNELHNTIQNQIDDVYRNLESKSRDLDEQFRHVYSDFERYRDEVDRRFDECHSFVDSRCDKLDNKICGKNCKCKSTEKQLLTD